MLILYYMKIPHFCCHSLLLLICFFTPLFGQEYDLARIDALLNEYSAQDRLNGTVLIAQGDDVIYSKGFGMAHMEWEVANTPDTRFRIGSITKQFTAALILQLVEEGKVDLEGKLTDYVPDYPAEHGKQVTIHQLLNHTSGIVSYTGRDEFWKKSRDPYTPKEFLEAWTVEELEFEPGSKWNYNNSGYYILGVVIQEVTGMPYDKALQKRLLDPLGLVNTGYEHFHKVTKNRASGYLAWAIGYQRAGYVDTGSPFAAGMMYSTVGDLHKWTRALHAAKPFNNKETLEKMITPYMQNYGYGIMINERTFGEKSVKVISHGGGVHGFVSTLSYFPEKELTVAGIDNTSSNIGVPISAVFKILHGQEAGPVKLSAYKELHTIITKEGMDPALARFRDIRENHPDKYLAGERQLTRLAQHYLEEGLAEMAQSLLEENLKYFSESEETYILLGHARLELGAKDQAIADYKKVLEINPGNAPAKEKLEELGVVVEEKEVTIPLDVLDSYLGEYELGPGFTLTLSRDEHQLLVTATGSSPVEFFPKDNTHFYAKIVNAKFAINSDEEGVVTGMTYQQDGRTMEVPKIK